MQDGCHIFRKMLQPIQFFFMFLLSNFVPYKKHFEEHNSVWFVIYIVKHIEKGIHDDSFLILETVCNSAVLFYAETIEQVPVDQSVSTSSMLTLMPAKSM